jgi:hypothetical protein
MGSPQSVRLGQFQPSAARLRRPIIAVNRENCRLFKPLCQPLNRRSLAARVQFSRSARNGTFQISEKC